MSVCVSTFSILFYSILGATARPAARGPFVVRRLELAGAHLRLDPGIARWFAALGADRGVKRGRGGGSTCSSSSFFFSSTICSGGPS